MFSEADIKIKRTIKFFLHSFSRDLSITKQKKFNIPKKRKKKRLTFSCLSFGVLWKISSVYPWFFIITLTSVFACYFSHSLICIRRLVKVTYLSWWDTCLLCPNFSNWAAAQSFPVPPGNCDTPLIRLLLGVNYWFHTLFIQNSWNQATYLHSYL